MSEDKRETKKHSLNERQSPLRWTWTADVGPSVGRGKRINQNAKKYASVGPLVERQKRKSLKRERTNNTA